MEEKLDDVKRALRIVRKLHKIGIKPAKIAKLYYPFRPYYLMVRTLKGILRMDDIEAWEKALQEYEKTKKKSSRKSHTKKVRQARKIVSQRESSNKTARNTNDSKE